MNRPDVEVIDPGTGEVATTATTLPEPVGAIPKDLTEGMPLALRIYFDNDLYNRTKQVAQLMAKARGFTPRHLIDQGEACFAITSLSLRTGIDPFFLAQNTFQTPNGQVGYMTRAVQAIIDQSGVLTRVPQRTYEGDWNKLVGMYRIAKSDKGKEYAQPTWGKDDAKGLSLTITLHFKDQEQPEPFTMELTQAFPLFSTMWATDPKTQFYNLVCRRAINTLRPGALAGVRHSDDLLVEETRPAMRDITPKGEASGAGGLDGFAAETTGLAETIVEPVAPAKEKPDTKADSKPKVAAKKAEKAKPEAEGDVVTIYVSADEPKRLMKNVDNAVFVLRNLIKDAKTAALAQAVFNQNVEVINKAGDQAVNDLEAELTRRVEKGDPPPNGDAGDDRLV